MRTVKIEFVQGDDYAEAGRILDEQGEDALFAYLRSLDGPTSEVITDRREPWGTEDTVVWFTQDGLISPHRLGYGYVLAYNTRLGYAGLTWILEGWPYTDADGRTLWACCESSIGPTCLHRTEPSLDITVYADGTSVAAGRPFGGGFGGGFVKARLMCSDGVVRPTVRMSATADTLFSVPCAVRVKGMTVSGFMTFENRSGLTVDTDADPRVAKFVANAKGRNAGLLPSGAWTTGVAS